MAGLLLVGFVAGLVAGISPCILPVLPVAVVAGTAPGAPDSEAWRRRRAVGVVLGLVASFSVATLAGSELLSALDLPSDFLRTAGIAVLVVVGAGLLVPGVGRALEGALARLPRRQPTGRTSGVVLGLGLGLVFVPCAGPVLATITVLGATHRVSGWAVLLTLCFAAGAAVPLLILALAGDRLVSRSRALRAHGPLLRGVGGAVMIVMAVLIATNLTDGLQRAVPGYTSALQGGVEGNGYVRGELAGLTGHGGAEAGSLDDCNGDGDVLLRCGSAPAFMKVTRWLNTPGGRPLTTGSLRGKVVLVDFWTYSCINCQRSLPHVEAWYSRYQAYGLEVVGVHTPEFAFEHSVSNVVAATHQFGVHYPVAVDDAYGTWTAYYNEYWPADYLIDARGEIRHVHDGEGDYAGTETLIRRLLRLAHPGIRLPPRTDVADTTPKEPTNPETYLGYDRLQYLAGANAVDDRAASYAFPPSLDTGSLGLAGIWTVEAERMVAGTGAQMELGYQARDVYLVLGGQGTLEVGTGSGPTRTLNVSGPPGLYTLVRSPSLAVGTLRLSFSPGLEAYDFTFG